MFGGGAMANYIKVGITADFKDGTKKKVDAGGQEIMLARVGINYYAIANRCPHLNGDLSLGSLEGTIITCPRHHSQFDLKNGQVIKWTNWSGPVKAISEMVKSPRPVKTYKVKVEGNDISVEV
jgi:3-phenylpropionate/trans-cinnamate dioxygenase ferredoxin component